MNNIDNQTVDSVAIIGMGGSFPKAKDIDDFWTNLKAGLDCITHYSNEELLDEGIEKAILDNPNYVKAKGALQDIDKFDADFFDIGPKDAEIMDPQHRLFLECAWSALENSGYETETYKGLIGIYAGESMSSYAYLNVLPTIKTLQSTKSLQAAIGNDKDSLTTTVAYHLNLRGPAITVQTSSSTSLVAVSLACQQLLSYQCDIALAGGVSAGPPLKCGYLYEEGGINSKDGKCRTFDQQSNGFVPGFGVGLIVLKRLSEAIKDRDTIWAVIKGFAVNNDGNKKVSYSAPSIDAQADVIVMAQEFSEINPEDISYIETHGTATKLGDPVEIAALTQAFRRKTKKKNFCAIGSVKTNIGHLDVAAGIAGLIKTVLCLRHRMLVPNIHFNKPNPDLHLADSPFFVSTNLTEWKYNLPLRAGVTSLGMGGTNCHIILEEALTQDLRLDSDIEKNILFTLSAKTITALLKYIQNIYTFLPGCSYSLSHIAYTYNFGRQPMKYRISFVASSKQELITKLQHAISNPSAYKPSTRKTIAFFYAIQEDFFTSDNSLYHQAPVFKNAIDKCLNLITPSFKKDLFLVFQTEKSLEFSDQFKTKYNEICYFMSVYALASLYMDWGIVPEFQVGFGVGELVAAVVGQAMSLDSALILLQQRIAGNTQVENFDLSLPKIPFISHLTGKWISEKEVKSSSYWHALQLKFPNDSIETTLFNQPTLMLFLGSSQIDYRYMYDGPKFELEKLAKPTYQVKIDIHYTFKILGELFEQGCLINWSNFYREKKLFRVPLPTYPFERKRYWLEKSLPQSSSIFLNQGPTTFHERPHLKIPYQPPSSQEEIAVNLIWENILGFRPIGIDDNFFDLGGNSLDATSLLSSINELFKKNITLGNFYKKPTIREMASLLIQIPAQNFEDILDEVMTDIQTSNT